jgi:hypothetical protein
MKKNRFKKLKKKEDSKTLINKKRHTKAKIIKNKKNKTEKNLRLKKIRQIVLLNVPYNAIKFKNKIYSIGDSIFVKDQHGNYVIARIKKIRKINGYKKYPFWPTLEVEW